MKPWNETVFREKRPHLARFVDQNIQPILDSCKRILVHAPVKSGKREMIEYIAVSNPFYSHVMISSWYRKVDNDQRAELEQHGLAVFTITNEKSLLSCLDWIKREPNPLLYCPPPTVDHLRPQHSSSVGNPRECMYEPRQLIREIKIRESTRNRLSVATA